MDWVNKYGEKASRQNKGMTEASTQTTVNDPTNKLPISSKRYCLKKDVHSSHILNNIRQMMKRGELCDITLVVGCKEYKAHKIILASVSPYFSAMFSGSLKERSQDEITLFELDEKAVDLLIDYAYCGEVTITHDNVEGLLPASNLMQIEDVTEACCRFLGRQMHATNCLGIRNFAHLHSCQDLYEKARSFAIRHFSLVISYQEFLLLSFDQVKEFLTDEKLNVAREEEVCDAALKWLKHDPSERSRYTYDLMQNVKLPLVNTTYLVDIFDKEKLIRENDGCKDLLLEAMRHHLMPEQRYGSASPRTSERTTSGLKPYLFVIGGSALFVVHKMCDVYNPRTKIWYSMAPLQTPRTRAGVTGAGRLLYAVGGFDGKNVTASAEYYNPLNNSWSYIKSMNTERSSFGISSFDGHIYVCGGFDESSYCMNSIEMYDPLTDRWNSCPSMKIRRKNCKTAVLDNSIYVMGGIEDFKYQNTVERYDPREGTWSSVASMKFKRSDCSVAVLNGHLYCIGGSDGPLYMATAERFDARKNVWEEVAAMHFKRASHATASINKNIVAVGGIDGKNSVQHIEYYEPSINKWDMITPLATKRSSLGMATLDCIDLERVIGQSMYQKQKDQSSSSRRDEA